MQLSNALFGTAMGYSFTVLIVCCLPCTARRVPAWVVEVAAVFIVCSGTVLFMFSLPFYTGRVLGHDPLVHLESRHITDTGLLLAIDAILTATHMALPVRFCFVWPVEVVGVLCYLFAAYVLGSAEPENVMQYLAVLISLVVMAAVGKRNQENADRNQFLALIEEKSTRFQAEYRLSRLQEAQEERRPQKTPSHKTPSERESIPSTTESARNMMPPSRRAAALTGTSGNADFLAEIAAIGEKEHWLIEPDEVNIHPGKVLGEGGFGKVLQGLYQGVNVAIKVPKGGEVVSNPADLSDMCNELRVLRRLRHPNIVFLYGACLDQRSCHLALVLELVQGISLDRFVQPWKRPPTPEPQQAPGDIGRSQVLLDVTCALRYLHSRKPHVLHGDLKDSNIFVEQWQGNGDAAVAKLLDFGLSRMVTKHALPMGGTVIWMAPEILKGGRSSATNLATDIFSFGRLVYFVLSGVRPFGDVPKRDFQTLLRAGQLPPMQWPPSGFLVKSYQELVDRCCDSDPRRRPGSSHVHEHAKRCHRELLGLQVASPEDSQLLNVRQLVEDSPKESSPPQPCDINDLFEQVPPDAGELCDLSELFEKVAPDSDEQQQGLPLTPVPEEASLMPYSSNPKKTGVSCSTQLKTTRATSSDTTSRLSVPEYRCTREETVKAMILEVLMTCNIEMPVTKCCVFHGALHHLIMACNALSTRSCSRLGLEPDMIAGQCPSCDVLIRQREAENADSSALPDECFFCGEDLPQVSSI